jgi:prepilin peptidase CpaA
MMPFIALSLGLAAAVVIDVRSRRIPNWLTGAIAGAGFGLAAGGGGVTPAQAALGLLAGLALMLPGHVIGATGAGDVKLMAAIGSFLGPALVLRAFLFSAVAGGALAIAVAMHRGLLAETLTNTGALVTAPAVMRGAVRSPGRANRFAYAPAIAAGTLFALLVNA